MSTWLSPEWFDETRALWSDFTAPSGLSARLQYEVSGGPDGSFSGYWILEGGRLADSGPGVVEGPDVTVTLTWDDALAVHRGTLDPNVAFMRGRMKVAGSMSVMMALLPATNTPEYRDLRRRVASATDF